MNEFVFRVKDVKHPEARYDSLWHLPVQSSIPYNAGYNLFDALREIGNGYRERFNERLRLSVIPRGDRTIYALKVESSSHCTGLEFHQDNSAELFFPSELTEKTLYVLDELRRVFKVTSTVAANKRAVGVVKDPYS